MKKHKEEKFLEIEEVGLTVSEKLLRVDKSAQLKVVTFSKNISNPELLLIPGWVSQFGGWQEVVIELSKAFTVHYLETREKNSSKIDYNSEISVDIIAKDISLAVKELGLKERKFLILGSSLGATAIVESFRYLREKPKAIILMGPNVHFRAPWWGKLLINHLPLLFSKPLKIISKFYLKHFRLDYKSDPDQYKKYAKVIDEAEIWKLKNSAKSFQHYKIWDSVKFVDRPSLIICAIKDKLHEPENIRKLHQELNDSEIIYLKTNKEAHEKSIVNDILKFWEKL